MKPEEELEHNIRILFNVRENTDHQLIMDVVHFIECDREVLKDSLEAKK